ncbi:ras-related and estrogen-regulated growth inhibitor-like protein [Mytilus galloprovincialis]|uniref:ras-related and estrogen-regulated growth inhibitor-like protein n=1 Tax=Mytilus galloprovincialis TaxID=29158 RepID=UPI003F7C155F
MSLRVVVLGAENVGKSAVTVRFLTRRFIGEYNSNMDLIYKSSIKQEDYVTDIEILDSCAKKNTSIAPGDNVITWTDAFIVVYDICVHSSFEQAIKILDIINKARASVYCPALLLGNKTDLEHRRTVGVEEGHQAALEYNCQYYEVSAADDFVTISIAFQALLRETKIIQQNKPLLKRRKSSLVNVSKKLGAMFGKKDSEMDRKRSTCDVAGPKTIFEKA